MNRRQFLASIAAAGARAGRIPIIDTHIHLFDPTRPRGVPWPEPRNKILYRPALPARYRKIAVPLGIVGAVAIEASPWLEDNDWLLKVAEQDPIMVGVVGNLEPGKRGFGTQLERFHRRPLFRGIRYGNLWGRNLAAAIATPEFLPDLKLLAQAGLTLDTANPDQDLIVAVVRLADRVPELTVVIDHLPQMNPQPEEAVLRELGSRPHVFIKISEVFRRVDGQVPRGLSTYRATLDRIVDAFGDDRLLYGSDWPNSDLWRPYGDVLGLVCEYFAEKPPATAEKYFWKNSLRAYRWVKRDASQPG